MLCMTQAHPVKHEDLVQGLVQVLLISIPVPGHILPHLEAQDRHSATGAETGMLLHQGHTPGGSPSAEDAFAGMLNQSAEQHQQSCWGSRCWWPLHCSVSSAGLHAWARK